MPALIDVELLPTCEIQSLSASVCGGNKRVHSEWEPSPRWDIPAGQVGTGTRAKMPVGVRPLSCLPGWDVELLLCLLCSSCPQLGGP